MLSKQIVDELRQTALMAIKSASKIHERRDFAIDYKGSVANLVTDIDRESEEILKNSILQFRPGDSIIGEEATNVTGTSGLCWYLDPLDGTTNFVHGYWGHAISVGIAMESKPVLGVVLDTSRGNLYVGGQGLPATRDGQSIKVSSRRTLGECLVATGFLADGEIRRTQAALLGDVLPLVRDVRRSGSPALDLCSVAFGAVDVYYEAGIGLIDTCAGAAIVEAAGGIVRRFTIDGLPDTVWVVGNQVSTNNFIKAIQETKQWVVTEI